jgi:hypothetical protein
MSNFRFDFIALPRQLVWLRWAFLILGAVAALGVLVYERTQLVPRLDALREQVSDQRAKMGGKVVTSSLKPEEVERAWKLASGAASQLSMRWSQFFVSLGEASSAGPIAFISIEPDASKSQVTLVAEARSLETMLKVIKALQDTDEFSAVTLQSHSINRAAAEKPIRFRLVADWKAHE